jgi:hypothetical protein
MHIDPTITWTIALSVAALLATAAIHKFIAWDDFRAVVRNYELLPDALVSFGAGIVTVLEASAAVLLVFSASRASGAYLAATLLGVYSGAMTINLFRGRVDLDCGCLGVARRQPIRWWMVSRNLIIAGVTLLAAARPTPRALGGLDALTITGAALSLTALYVAYNLLQAPRTSRGTA